MPDGKQPKLTPRQQAAAMLAALLGAPTAPAPAPKDRQEAVTDLLAALGGLRRGPAPVAPEAPAEAPEPPEAKRSRLAALEHEAGQLRLAQLQAEIEALRAELASTPQGRIERASDSRQEAVQEQLKQIEAGRNAR